MLVLNPQVEGLKKKNDAANYLNPEKSAEANELGKEQFKAGKFPEAISHYSEVSWKDVVYQNWRYYIYLFTFLRKQAIKRNPLDPKLYANRAACYVKLMTWGKAMEDCDHCLKLDPLFVKAYIRKGKIQVINIFVLIV